MKKIVLFVSLFLSVITVAHADGPVNAYGQSPYQYSEDEEDGLVNADGAQEDPQAAMSTTARAYRNGIIGGRRMQRAEDDARFAQYQQQQQQQYPQYPSEQVAEVYIDPRVPGIVRSNQYPPTRGLNDPMRPQETCYYNSCHGYSRSVVQEPPRPVYYVQPEPRYVAPRVVLPPRFNYNDRYRDYPLANGYRGYVPVQPQRGDTYYSRTY
jgi:hypothetical protein